ncbi:radical SAM protein [Arcobacter sp. CECT 8983]|uniref:viperin family antiviral radical SAM protein n=1 Tax=Arcobacter sp. CECT 8983 TaxID=2044508 RepID=UPI00100A6880|nr:viperin family antiviral radical SAM protein [Arcobacter sp. CECT 8983]RXJ89183.1 radical SAM protein [Arcobacter sp. CECT 8983]
MKEITINWHIIQKCNYKCYYCFAKYEKSKRKEIHYSKKEIEILLNKIYKTFNSNYKDYDIRLNIAGGEPTLSKNLGFIIETAYRIGFNVSIITNSSILTTMFIKSYAKYLSMFAISIDSINRDNNIKIGRVQKEKSHEISQVFRNIELLRNFNKDLKIKINTVVNKHNYNEYLGNFINLIKPDKWKIFQALSINSDEIHCNEAQYKTFLQNHKDLKVSTFTESNDEMIDSYIMIDPHGRFYQNTNGTYTYSKSILDITENEIAKCFNVDMNKYNERYEENNYAK